MPNLYPVSHRTLLKAFFHLCLALVLVSGFFAMQPHPAYAATVSVTNNGDSGPGSLRDTIAAASAGETINFSFSGTITLTTGQLSINKDLTIDGAGKSIVIDGGGTDHVFCVTGGVVAINALTIQNGTAASSSSVCTGIVKAYGGAIDNSGTLTVTNSTFTGNTASQLGGAINNNNVGTLTVTNSTFTGNTSSTYGGAIDNSGTLTVTNSSFSGNSAGSGGGGAIDNSGTLTVTNSTFTGNSTSNLGGAIQNLLGTATVSSSSFSNNSSSAIYDLAQLSVDSSIFSNNSSSEGAAILDSGALTVTRSTFTGNTSSNDGGAITAAGTAVDVSNSTFTGNSASTDGGGIEILFSTTTATVTNSTFFQNTASAGGGLDNQGTLTLNSSTFSQNAGTGDGGGAISNGGTMTVLNSITANSTQGSDCLVAQTAFTASGANFDTDGSCAGSSPAFSTQKAAQLNLGSLANNGGLTQTIALGTGSVAIDAVPAGQCTVKVDQRGILRPQGSACDVGAYEYTPVAASAQSPMCSVLGFPNTGLVKAVVPPGIATTGNVPVTICYGILTDPTQIGVLNRPITLAVEVVAYTQTQTPVSVAPLLQPISICLSGSGTLLYRDATGQPRVVTTLSAFSNGGYTCASIPDAGTVILVPGPAAPAGNLPSIAAGGPSHALSACSIKTQDIVNLHTAPDASSTVIAQLPTGTTLYATARAGDWIKVIYQNTQGWLAVRYLALDGQCD